MITQTDKLWLKAFSSLNELQRRLFAAQKANELGWGGVSTVCKLTGMSHHTVKKGLSELTSKRKPLVGRLRKPGGGRKKLTDKFPKLKKNIERILDENTAGDPMGPLKWTHKSTYAISKQVSTNKIRVSEVTVGRVLNELRYSLQGNRKSKEHGKAPERDAQFQYINRLAKKFMRNKLPVVSVDTKKKELVGNFKNAGRTWRKKGKPIKVNVYDFANLSHGKAIPYGAYDLTKNEGFVSVGISSDTAEFSVESIRQWWLQLGKSRYPDAKELLITADAGGSNGYRNAGWKYFLQKFADESKLTVTVLHFPPGTSKWNKIEHRLFSFITKNWGGKPLVSYAVILSLIRGTNTNTGLKVFARLDRKKYATGLAFSEEQLSGLNVRHHSLNRNWNYTITPSIN